MQKSDDKTRPFYSGIFHWLQEALYSRLDEYLGDDETSRRMFIKCLQTMRAITRSCPSSLSHDQLSYLHTHVIVTNSAEARVKYAIVSVAEDTDKMYSAIARSLARYLVYLSMFFQLSVAMIKNSLVISKKIYSVYFHVVPSR